mgnify:CR=1 FL=1
MNETLLISILAASITAGTPILFAALGELISERAGVTNLGVDGMMLVGACAGFIAAQQTGSRAGIAGVQLALRRGQAVQADALYDDLLVGNIDGNAHFAEAVDGGQAVLAHQKAGDMGGAAGQSAEHDGAVGDGFIARHGDLTAQRRAGIDLHGSILLLVG